MASEHVEVNRRAWTAEAGDYVEPAKVAWAKTAPDWGIWSIPEADVQVLGEVAGLDVVELGCGTAYFSAWLMRMGARPVGVDLTPAQLDTARAMQAEHGLEFPLIEADAEDVPLPDAAFDLAVSEYGASLWCEPRRWLAEAARLLRRGGRLVFLTSSPLSVLCSPPDGSATTEVLHRPQFGALGRTTWEGEDGVEFHLAHGDMIAVLAECGFRVERLVELQAPEGARTRFGWVTPDWARRWPSEEIWVARRA